MATLTDLARNTSLDAITALLHSGKLVLHTSANAVVATCTLADPGFGAASGGSATAGTIASGICGAAGVIDHAHLYKSDNTPVMQLTVGVSGSSSELTMSSLTFAIGDTATVSALVLTQAAS